jgi:hypothetical protein
MRRTLALVLLLGGLGAEAQSLDSLKSWSTTMLRHPDGSVRQNMALRVIQGLDQWLAEQKGPLPPPDSLPSITLLNSPDGKLGLVNWEWRDTLNILHYEGRIRYLHPITKTWAVVALETPADAEKRNPQSFNDPSHWLSCHYYYLMKNPIRKKNSYVLLGFDGGQKSKKRKIMDFLVVEPGGKLSLGMPVLETGGQMQRRFVLEYAPEVSVGMRYDARLKAVVFDHLVPMRPELKGQSGYYVPDLSYDAFQFQKGKWKLLLDVDARNPKGMDEPRMRNPK